MPQLRREGIDDKGMSTPTRLDRVVNVLVSWWSSRRQT